MKAFQLAVSLAAAVVLTSAARAQNQIVIGLEWPTYYGYLTNDSGYLPKIASDRKNGLATVIFENGKGNAEIEYDNGYNYAGNMSLEWVGPGGFVNGEIGHAPSVAMVDCAWECDELSSYPTLYTAAIQVHQGGQDNGSLLWYRTGAFATDQQNPAPSGTNWSASQQYSQGYNPTVALDQAGSPMSVPLVEVHQSGEDSSELWYHFGTLNYTTSPWTVTWGTVHDTKLSGYAPTVSIYNGLAVMVAEGPASQLWYSLGVVDNANNTIKWGTPIPYDKGYNPSVSVQACDIQGLSCEWLVAEAHQADTGTGPLWNRFGMMSSGSSGTYPNSITWTVNSPFQTSNSGCYPSVSLLNNTTGVGGFTNGILQSSSSECAAVGQLYFNFGYLYLPN